MPANIRELRSNSSRIQVSPGSPKFFTIMTLSQARSIFIAGHRGMVGSALVRALGNREGLRIITTSRGETDLTRQEEVERFLAASSPDIVVIAAAKVGGIHANATFPADFIYDNLMI